MNTAVPASIPPTSTSAEAARPGRGRYANVSWQSTMRFHSLLDQAMRAKPGLSASTPRPALSPQRVDQANVNEYENLAQARAWRGSTCSAASLTSVLRAHGLNTRIADVMKAMPGAITPELGLVSRQGLVRAAEHFGLKARDDVRTFDDLRRATASGTPVLVDVQNRQFPEGHWLVVKSATPTSVNVVDSSGYRLTSIPSDQFLRDWSGRGIRVNG